MDIKRYRERIANIDWSDLFETTNLDLAYDMFKNRVVNILDSEAPMSVKQVKKNFNTWIRQEMKDIMRQRDTARDKAKDKDTNEDWKTYRALRNRCTLETKKDNKLHYENMYNKCETDRDIKTTFRITKYQLGWTTGGQPETFLVDGKQVNSPKKITDIHNQGGQYLLPHQFVFQSNNFSILPQILPQIAKLTTMPNFIF